MSRAVSLPLFLLTISSIATAGVGDPQLKTDHPWYPGELACSTFERLQATQAQVYQRVTGRMVQSDEDRALASWLWRNTHYAHGEPGAEDYFGQGYSQNSSNAPREYWTGLFAHGFALCGTTHAQWIGEMQSLLGHNRARCVGTSGHNSFEVFLTGGNYGDGRWVMLDHDLSTVVYNDEGSALLSIADLVGDYRRLTDRSYKPDRQHGWLVCGLHPDDGGVYSSFRSAEYFAGYAGPPPMVHLRRGEALRRYFEPGLEDGRTFVFWGRNYNTAGVPGPERAHTWVNQPEKMHGSRDGAGYRPGQMRYGNAVYMYEPDFSSGDYLEGIVEQNDNGLRILEFQTPYVIGATPPDDSPWGIYKPGCKNGLVLEGLVPGPIYLSVDRGISWQAIGKLEGKKDVTDLVKGRHQYWLKFFLVPGQSRSNDLKLKITTVCQVNPAILPRLKDNGTEVTFAASGRALVSAGPSAQQAKPHIVAGAFDTPRVTLQLAAPRKTKLLGIHAAAHVKSSNPPSPEVAYRVEYSLDEGRTWKSMISDWRITRRGNEPADFWSQSFCWGSKKFDTQQGDDIQVRFSNTGGKAYARAEAHLEYEVPVQDDTRITFAWTDDEGPHQHRHVFPAGNLTSSTFTVPTGKNVRTRWVEMR